MPLQAKAPAVQDETALAANRVSLAAALQQQQTEDEAGVIEQRDDGSEREWGFGRRPIEKGKVGFRVQGLG